VRKGNEKESLGTFKKLRRDGVTSFCGNAKIGRYPPASMEELSMLDFSVTFIKSNFQIEQNQRICHQYIVIYIALFDWCCQDRADQILDRYEFR